MCENMNDLAFKEVSANDLNEKREANDKFEEEVRGPSQKEAKTLVKKKESTKERDIKSFKEKVFKAEISESSDAETNETSGAEICMYLKGPFTKSLEEKGCEPSQKEVCESLREEDGEFSDEHLCLARDGKSTEGEANKAKYKESQEDSESSQKVISELSREYSHRFSEGPLCLAKANESVKEEDSESSQEEERESSENVASGISDVDTSVENATSLSEGQTFSSNATCDGTSSEADSYSSECVCRSNCYDTTTSEDSSKSPKKKHLFKFKFTKWFEKVCRQIKGAFSCCTQTKSYAS